ncbi:MAG TPA: STAS domain-containing protein [Anaeromyxobacter sp.]
MMDVTRGTNGEIVIRIDGTFDAKDASRLAGWLVEVSHDDALVLDFTQVRACEDFGLARLAPDLATRDRIQVRGLTRHQERMLRYLGVDVDKAEGLLPDALGAVS